MFVIDLHLALAYLSVVAMALVTLEGGIRAVRARAPGKWAARGVNATLLLIGVTAAAGLACPRSPAPLAAPDVCISRVRHRSHCGHHREQMEHPKPRLRGIEADTKSARGAWHWDRRAPSRPESVAE